MSIIKDTLEEAKVVAVGLGAMFFVGTILTALAAPFVLFVWFLFS